MIPGPPPGGPSLGAEAPLEAPPLPPFGVPGNTVPLAARARLVDHLTGPRRLVDHAELDRALHAIE